MAKWFEKKVGDFLFEREGKYKPDAPQIKGLKRIEKIDFSGNFYIGEKASRTNMILVHPSDLVISGINVAKGAMGIYLGKNPVTATIHYSSYTFDEKQIDVDYFKRFLKSPEFLRLLKEQVKGGIKTEIKPKHILPLRISIPSLGEQKNIVSHFKNIETEDQDLKSELTHQQSLLKKLRQQILQEAIEGKLTADWRQQNPDVEPASELLKRIREEKEQLIQDKKICKPKPLPAITADEIPFDIPEGWEWCRLGEIANFLNGYAFKSSWFTDKGIRLVRNVNVSHGTLNWDDAKSIPHELARGYLRFSLDEGDIVLSLDRPIISTGLKAARVEAKDLPALLLQRVLKIDPVIVSSTYVFKWLFSRQGYLTLRCKN